MKKGITTILALFFVVSLIPFGALHATDYNGYDNSTKTVLMEWVENAINADDITFNPDGADDAFLDLVDTLYAKRDASDWDGCVTVAGYLEAAAQYIVGTSIRSYVESCCDVTGWFYGVSDLMCMTDGTETAIQYSLATANPSYREVRLDSAHAKWCTSAGGAHFATCSMLYFTVEEEER